METLYLLLLLLGVGGLIMWMTKTTKEDIKKELKDFAIGAIVIFVGLLITILIAFLVYG